MNKSSDISSDRTWSLGRAEKSNWLIMQEFHHASQIALDQRAWQHEVKGEKENSSRCNNKNRGDSVAVFRFEWSLLSRWFFATQLFFSNFHTKSGGRFEKTHQVDWCIFFQRWKNHQPVLKRMPQEQFPFTLLSGSWVFWIATQGSRRSVWTIEFPGCFLEESYQNIMKRKDAGLSQSVLVYAQLNFISLLLEPAFFQAFFFGGTK